jgi:hypothetical protein
MQKSDGMNYAPKGKPSPVVKPGEFIIAAVALDQNLLITLYSRSGHTTLFRQRDFREAEAAVHIRLRPRLSPKPLDVG